jgi:hypothetical protein
MDRELEEDGRRSGNQPAVAYLFTVTITSCSAQLHPTGQHGELFPITVTGASPGGKKQVASGVSSW